MNKRQLKKIRKKQIPEEFQFCQECGKRLDLLDNYQLTWGTCDQYCYMHLVGLSISDFI
jgi:hypothetical protein